MPSIWKRWEGRRGNVSVPTIGLEIGSMDYWSIQRREDTPSGVEEWDLRAVFSYVNAFAFEKRADKEVRIWLGDPKRNGKQFRLQETSGRTVLEGRSLLMEKVTLWPLESPKPR